MKWIFSLLAMLLAFSVSISASSTNVFYPDIGQKNKTITNEQDVILTNLDIQQDNTLLIVPSINMKNIIVKKCEYKINQINISSGGDIALSIFYNFDFNCNFLYHFYNSDLNSPTTKFKELYKKKGDKVLYLCSK